MVKSKLGIHIVLILKTFKINKMQTITKRVRTVVLVLLISLCINSKLNAQTPADDPGIGGPGTSGSSPAGDGAPIVPYDNNMNLILVALGISYPVYMTRNRKIVVVG